MCKRPRCMQVSYPLTHRGHVVALAHCPFRSLLPPRLKNSLSFRLDVMHMTVLNGVLESSTLVQITGRDNPETQQTQTPILNVARINTDRGNPEHSKRPTSFAPGQHRWAAPKRQRLVPQNPKPEDLCLGRASVPRKSDTYNRTRVLLLRQQTLG